MSSAAHLTMDEDAPISRDDWLAFCREHDITYSPTTIGRNVFYREDVEVSFGEPSYDELPRLPSGRLDFSQAQPPEQALRVTVSTFYGGNLEGVAHVAALIWSRWESALSASPEIRQTLLSARFLVPA